MNVPGRCLFLWLLFLVTSLLAACSGEGKPMPTGLSSLTLPATETPAPTGTSAPTAIPTGAPTVVLAATETPASTPSRTPALIATLAPAAVPVDSPSATPTAAPTPAAVPTVTVVAPLDFLSTIALSGPVSSSAIAVSPDGAMVAAVNPDSNSITLVNAQNLEVINEVPVGGDPVTLSFTPDSRTVVVANRKSATLSSVDVEGSRNVTHIPVGSMPYGVASDGQRAFVSEFALGNLAIIDLADNSLVKRLPVGPFPAGLAILPGESVDGDSGDLLLVTHFFSGDVTAIDLDSFSVKATASTGAGINLSQSIVVEPYTSKAYLPQTRSNSTNTAMTFDTTVFPVVNVLDLVDFSLVVRQRITIDTADRPASIPFAPLRFPRTGPGYS